MRNIVIFIFFLCSVSLFAQEITTTPNKQRFIELVNSGQYDQALKEYTIVKDWYCKTSECCLDIANSLYDLGTYYFYNRNYVIAEDCYIKSLRMMEDNLGNDCNNYNYATLLGDLGALYYQLAYYSASEEYNIESLLIKKILFGENHPDYVLSLENLGTLYCTLGNYSLSEQYLLRCLQILKDMGEVNNTQYIMVLDDLGALYCAIGDYILSEKYLLESLQIGKKVLGENSLDYAELLNDLGTVYFYLENYSLSEKYLLDALEIVKEKLGEQNAYYATLLNNIATFYNELGNYSKSLKYHLESFRIRNDLFGENHPDYAITLSNLGTLYEDLGNYSKSLQYYLKSLVKYEEIYGETHPDYLIGLCQVGRLYSYIGDYFSSKAFYLLSLEITKEVYGENNSIYANALSGLAEFNFVKGNYDTAKKYELESLRIVKEVYNTEHPKYKNKLRKIGILYSKLNEYNEAEQYIIESNICDKRKYTSSLDYLTERDRALFWETLQHPFEYTYPLFAYNYHFTNPSISTFAYDNELFRKGLLLNSADAVRRSILESGDSVLIEQWNELTEAKQVVMNLEEKEPNSNQLDIYRHRADSLEKIMTISSSAFRQSKEQWNINWESVKKQLSKNEVAIEYFSAPLSKDSTMYCALVLRHNSKYPELIPLFEEKEVASYLDKATEGSTNNLYSFEGEGEYISNIVWSKILSKIKPGETIYFAPTGILHQLAIEYLPYDEQRTMSDVYNMVRLSSTREIVTNKSKESYKSAVVYGGIHYDLDNNVILEESNRYPEVKHRTLENDSINRGSAKFLPGTKAEAEKINKLLSDNKIEVKIFKTKTANEESFKSLSGKHNNILHIATHGFTWADSTARKQDYFADRMKMQLMGDNQMRGPIIDPLDRCGLLFAGANTALQGKSKELPEGVQDGILTAKEISLMDLRDAELVVLSACETAKGDITSEGVFGLQRAFKMAGAKTIIMSLWKVDDRATQLLMTEFYNNWINKKQSKREAFRNAQNSVKEEFKKPEYWAGFVMLD